MIILGQYCAHPSCGGTLAAEADLWGWRVFCTNCGRDRWIEAPERRSADVSAGYTAEQSADGRRCIDCDFDISSRHMSALRCFGCGKKAERRPGSRRKKLETSA